RALILSGGEQNSAIGATQLNSDSNASHSVTGLNHESLLALPLREARDAFERDYVAAQLSRFGGNISRTSAFIGMERSALHRKIKMLGLTGRDSEQTEE
ncbi:MAG: helix-turn-helix domain-containing protein, partial [Aestuariivirga sp.]